MAPSNNQTDQEGMKMEGLEGEGLEREGLKELLSLTLYCNIRNNLNIVHYFL
jgi:hypothetical protein